MAGGKIKRRRNQKRKGWIIITDLSDIHFKFDSQRRMCIYVDSKIHHLWNLIKTNLPAGSKLLPSQRALQIGDNRDKVADILYWLLQNSPDSGNLPTYSDILNGYGCWCQFYDAENWASSNKGTPVDNLDTACRSWNKCYDCINRDDSTCDGISSTYRYKHSQFS